MKKPNSNPNNKAEAESLFQMQQGSNNISNNNMQKPGNTGNLISIDDLLGGPVNNNNAQVTNQNTNVNNDNLFDNNIFGVSTNNANYTNSNNIVDFGFVVNNNNNNINQAQNSNANNDLFGMENSSNQQIGNNQQSKSATGGFNADDLLKSKILNRIFSIKF